MVGLLDRDSKEVRIFRSALLSLKERHNLASWEEMAKIINISVSEMYNLKNGARTPSFKTTVAIANVFGVPIAFLYLDSESPEEATLRHVMLEVSTVELPAAEANSE